MLIALLILAFGQTGAGFEKGLRAQLASAGAPQAHARQDNPPSALRGDTLLGYLEGRTNPEASPFCQRALSDRLQRASFPPTAGVNSSHGAILEVQGLQNFLQSRLDVLRPVWWTLAASHDHVLGREYMVAELGTTAAFPPEQAKTKVPEDPGQGEGRQAKRQGEGKADGWQGRPGQPSCDILGGVATTPSGRGATKIYHGDFYNPDDRGPKTPPQS